MYDIAIIGCGPAGLTAAIYALRANKKVVIFEKENIGGKITSSPLVENYPGFKSISGSELANNLYEQVIELGGEIKLEEVLKISLTKIKKIKTDEDEYQVKAIIIATGSKYRMLHLEHEEEFIGNRISFCVACDGAFYKDQTVAVIGGGNSAVINAISLSEICNKVYLIQNISKLTAEAALVTKLKSQKNVEIIYDNSVIELIGNKSLEKIKINNRISHEDMELKVDGIFVSIGQIPENDIFKGKINLNEYNYIKSDESCHTNIDGIFVAGDCKEKRFRQLTTAVSDGTIAALEAIDYLDR